MTSLRSIAILWDSLSTTSATSAETGAAEAAAVASIGGVIDEVAHVAASLGLRVERVPLASDARTMLAQVAAIDADVVVNLAESWAGRVRNEAGVAWTLELRGCAYTGATPRALALCLEKPLTRALLASAGVPVPEGATMSDARAPWPLDVRGPWIVKPAAQDASHGVDATSVVHDERAARARVDHLITRGLGPALIERYVDGRELNVSIVELDGAPPRALPIAEIDYSQFPAELPRILTFAAKWDETSDEYRGSASVEARDLDPTRRARVEQVALAAWRALGLRDYGRVDLRLDRDGAPFVIDVNPNPDLSRGAGLCLAAERAGIGYEGLIAGLLRGAARRAHPD
ncbi:D-alanine--D-alanine ligase family protein [Sandaracinus amylolyticus]|uniref:D-alanine--D-alanine ligase n=1 Tax=Sandaracinus amylolyticus TaxID=927083 RepID=A0A0F6YML8_9BACT|nr:ATP-grasp domain-containing protein [Sandaracinus amylolyticus]AKF11501.1 D-alanine--D-alanine ligase [Sandaracinus amylolyticus]